MRKINILFVNKLCLYNEGVLTKVNIRSRFESVKPFPCLVRDFEK